MEMNHLSDEQLQEYLAGAVEEKQLIEQHLAVCPQCNQSILVYRKLFESLKETQTPLILFDLESVMQKIAQKQTTHITGFFVRPIMIGGICFLSVMLVGLLLVCKHLVDTEGVTIFLIVVVGSFLALFLAGDLINQYKKKYQEFFAI